MIALDLDEMLQPLHDRAAARLRERARGRVMGEIRGWRGRWGGRRRVGVFARD